ncbi:30S ribosomal protein S13 [Candidatus Tremblaya princeps]|uniref:30S ribosomal protein S13 n=1 Tax=Tremblaya princeps TaxID=189385 RepID=A0A143WNI3_TREPR|nr:30S ribosomal protein S13 [Candidatus Tremblaya princeps]
MRAIGVDIPGNLSLEMGLTRIHGIGRALSARTCLVARVDLRRAVRTLRDADMHRLRQALGRLTLQDELRRRVSKSVRRLVDINSLRGLRHGRHLPVRGQRTRTNAKTCKRRRPGGARAAT